MLIIQATKAHKKRYQTVNYYKFAPFFCIFRRMLKTNTMEESNYIKVFTGNFIITQLMVDKLDAVGISAIIKDESESGRLGGFGTFNQGTQELYVNKDELETAVPIIESITAEMKA